MKRKEKFSFRVTKVVYGICVSIIWYCKWKNNFKEISVPVGFFSEELVKSQLFM
jgi:hypothetical protein